MLLTLASCGGTPAGREDQPAEETRPVEGKQEAMIFQSDLDKMILSPQGEEQFRDLIRKQSDADSLRLMLRKEGFKERLDSGDCRVMQRDAMRGPMVGGTWVIVTQCPDRAPKIQFMPIPPF